MIVYRLVTEGTVEAKILEKARSKRKLEKIVMQGGAMRALPGRSLLTKANLSLDDLAQALYSTDAESFKLSKLKDDEVPSPEDILNAEELEKLLDRSFGTPDAAKAESSTPAKRGKKSPAKKSSDKEPSAASRFEEIGDGAWTNENADALAEHGAEATGK